MSRTDGDVVGQRDQVRHNSLNNNNNTSTGWEAGRPQQTRSNKDSDNVSPRSQGHIPLVDRQTEEIRRKIEEAKARASPPVHDLPRQPSQERVRPVEPATTAPPSSALGAVPPELLSELRKIIREEFVQLNKADVKDEATADKPQRSSVGRERASSPIRPFANAATAAAGPVPTTSSPKDFTEDRRTSTAAAAPSSTTGGSQKISPRQSTVRFSDETKPAAPITPRAEEPRKASPTIVKDVELTAIDKRWGVLFERDGTPTKRMHQVVKGLAKYIVDEFLPRESIVVTPEKMATLYSHHRLDREIFPFCALFKSRPKDLNEALANLYDDLGCQYFLVKADERSRPSVPSLTPAGFLRWLILMIQAHPDEEAKRLDKVVSALPIEADSLLDGKPERLPKQISRYLLPERPLKAQQRLVDEAMKDFQDELEVSSEPKLGRKNSTANKKSSPIVVTTSSLDKRSVPTSSTSGSNHSSSRYVPDSSAKDSRGEDTGGDRDRRNTSTAGKDASYYDDDRSSRRNSMPPPPPPGGKLGRTGSGSIDNSSGRHGGSSSSSNREAHTSSSSSSTATSSRAHGVSSSTSRKSNRSPQRKSYSQSVPAGLNERDDIGGSSGSDRYRGSGGISPAAVNVANVVLGSSSSSMPSPSVTVPSTSTAAAVDGGSARDTRRNSSIDFGGYRDRQQRSSLDDPAAATTGRTSSSHTLRDRSGLADLDDGSGSSSSRSSKRRSMFLPDVRGPTWDDYLKSSGSAPPPKSASSAFKNATSAFLRRGEAG